MLKTNLTLQPRITQRVKHWTRSTVKVSWSKRFITFQRLNMKRYLHVGAVLPYCTILGSICLQEAYLFLFGLFLQTEPRLTCFS